MLTSGVPLLAVASGRAGAAVGQILLVRISTELLSPAELGGVSEMSSLASGFSLILAVPVLHYITRGFLEWRDAGNLQAILKRFLIYVLFAATAAAVIAGAIQVQWHLVRGFGAAAVALLVWLFMLSSPVSAVGTTGLNLINKRIQFAVGANLPVWVALAAAPLFFRKYGGPEFWSLGQYLGPAVACLSFWVLWRHLKTTVVSHSAEGSSIPFTRTAILSFAWPVVVTSALWWIQSQSYRFVLDRIQGVTNVGLFVVGYSVAAAPIAMYEGLVGQWYEPIFYSELKGQDSLGQARAWNNYARAYLPGLVVAGAYVAAGSPFLARVLVGESFRTVAVQVAVWAAIIETMRAAGGMMYHLGMAKVDQKSTILPVVAGAVLAPLGVFVLGRSEPIQGTIAGLFIAGLAVMIIIAATARKALPITWPVRRILFGLLLSLPLVAGFEIVHWLRPVTEPALSLFLLGLGGVYLGAVQMWLFAGRERR